MPPVSCLLQCRIALYSNVKNVTQIRNWDKGHGIDVVLFLLLIFDYYYYYVFCIYYTELFRIANGDLQETYFLLVTVFPNTYNHDNLQDLIRVICVYL